MVNFPIFEKLDVTGYGLYPGKKGGPDGLGIKFQPGLTLILGANGLGKTTLVTILYRLLTGPFDIPALTGRGSLGNANLQAKVLSSRNRRVFAERVTDGAKNAVARLQLKIGDTPVVIERNLRDLSLVGLSIAGKSVKIKEEKNFQKNIARLAGVWSFGDWILLLRNMVFYFEDRRALVWDPSSQRQLLRLLLLPATTAQKWTEGERDILELDSRMRNLRFAAYREEQALSDVETKAKKGANVREELKTLESLQLIELNAREQLDDKFAELDSQRKSANLRYLKAQQERESRYRAFERVKLKAVEARFPQKSDSARYILEQLFAEADCLVCGNHVPAAAKILEGRIATNDCVVCGSDLSDTKAAIPAAKLADRRVIKAQTSLDEIEPELAEAERQQQVAEDEFTAATLLFAEKEATIGERTARIDALIRRLPPGEAEIHKQRSELASMRGRVEVLTVELAKKRDAFRKFVDNQNRDMVRRSAEIMNSFEQFAEGFLLEIVQLVWSPQLARVGQTGDPIKFPAFELDMSGADFPLPIRRSGPEHVSESQREFIDLAFRMALMDVASSSGLGNLVIDAPESSLDGVFASRAADVLARFAISSGGNRLTITSNLVEGDLIPELLKKSAPSGNRLSRVVNLFEIAEPTAAIRELGHAYRKLMKHLLTQVEPTNRPSARKPSRNPATRRISK